MGLSARRGMGESLMIYNLMHRDAVIKSFDTSTMEPDEIWAMKQLGDGRYFRLCRVEASRIPPMPEGYSQLADVEKDRARRRDTGYAGLRTGIQNYLPLQQ